MEKKQLFFRKLDTSIGLQCLFLMVSMLTLFIVYLPISYWVEKSVMEKRINQRAVEFDQNILSCINDVSVKEETIKLSGWVINLDSEIVDVKLILRQFDGEEKIYRTEQKSSNELETYKEYLDVTEKKIGQGFYSLIKEELQHNTSYEILLNIIYEKEYKNESIEETKKITTGQYIYNGEVYSYKPEEFITPFFQDEHMKTVISKGKMCGYNSEYATWVYLYENHLYWIVDINIEINRSDKLYTFNHLYTSKTEMLPEEYMENGFDIQDFFFKSHEINLENDINYRVATLELEQVYPVTYFVTGNYDDMRKLWSNTFILYHEKE